MEQENLDRRVRRTRAMLRQSLIELMGEKDLREITVTELTERADVNRGTFYSHYQDIYDMVRQVENELFDEFGGVLSAYPAAALEEGLYPILHDVFCFIRRNADLCVVLLDSGRNTRFLERLKALVYGKVEEDWGTLYSFPDPGLRQYTLSIFVGGVVGLIQKWAESGWQRTPEEMAALAQHMIEEGVGPLSVRTGT